MNGIYSYWAGLLIVAAFLLIGEVAVAHDPDDPEIEVPEVSVIGERPVSASSQQFIPDKEILLQPQGRPSQVLRLIPGFLAIEHSGGAGKADQYFLRGFVPITAPMSRSSQTGCRSICVPMPMGKATPT